MSKFQSFLISLIISLFATTIVFAWNSPTSAPPNSAGEVIYIDSSGNVGIGITGPSGLLHAYTANSSIVGLKVDTANQIIANFYKSGVATHQFGAGSGNEAWLQLNNNGASKIFLDTSGNSYFNGGNVGIGTTGPGTKLEVSGDIGLSSGGNKTISILGAANPGADLIIQAQNTATYAGVPGNLYLRAGQPTSSGTQDTSGRHVYIDGSNKYLNGVYGNVLLQTQYGGNVGIGTSSPAYKLDVNGNARITGTLTAGTISGGYTGTINAANVSSGDFGSNTGGGNFSFPANVGIGTTGPGAKLEVYGASAAIKILGPSTDDMQIIGGVDPARVGPTTNTQMALWANGAEVMRLKSGNVGIGTTNPATKLQVSGGRIRLDNNVGVLEFMNAAGNDQGLQLYADASDVARLNNNFGVLVLQSSGGNVGIGTSSPAYKLDVNGDARITGTLTAGTISGGYTGTINAANVSSGDFGSNTGGGNFSFPANVGIGTTGPGNYLTGNLAMVSSGDNYLSIVGGAANAVGIGFQDTTGVGIIGAIRYEHGDNSMDFFTNGGTQQMTILNTGNVGIGTTGPGAKLHAVTIEGWNSSSPTLRVSNGDSTNAEGNGLLVDAGNGSSDYVAKFQTRTGTDVMMIRADGLVGIGMTSPAYKLDVNGDARITGTVIANKITVGTIDPVYEINGKKYATYAPSLVGGVKEEYVGKARLSDFQYVIDFDKINKGDNLWVWRKTIDFSKDNVDVLITPYGEVTNIFYEIDGNKIIIKGDKKSAEFSYRLSGKRFDWQSWPTLLKNQTESANFIVK